MKHGFAGVVLVTLSCAHAPTASTANDFDRRANALADAVVREYFARFIQIPTLLRIPGERLDELPPASLAGLRARQQREDALRDQASQIDPARLGNPNARLALVIAREYLEDAARARVCRADLWAVSPAANGWQVTLGNVAQGQPVGTDELRAQALARFGQLPGYIDDQIETLREGVREGYTAAEPTVRSTIAQFEILESMSLGESPFFSPAVRDGQPAFRARWKKLVQGAIQPALHRYREFLAREYLPRARKKVGVSAFPDGDACYRASLRLFTTLDLDPREVHALGLRELAKLQAEMKQIADRSFRGAALPQLLQRMRSEPPFVYRDRADITRQIEGALRRAREVLPAAFHLLPRAEFVLEPIPAYQERAASPYYQPAALDGSRPAAYRVRYYAPEKQSRATGEAIAFHEVIPGHHLQIAIAHEREETPPIARYVINSGFSEGWGLYAERLADELHLYSGDVDRLGMLSSAAVRAVRLVVDSGIHTMGWERQKAIETMLGTTTFSPDQAAAEIDRYIAWPGQATAYTVGYLEILGLREEARRALGARFDLREFHDRVLEHGTVPLPILRQNIEAWIRGG